MKMIFRSKIYILLPMVLLFFLGACEKDEEPEQNTIRPGALTANFNGQLVDFSYLPTGGDSQLSDGTLSGIIIRGETENFAQAVDIGLMPFLGTGEYVIDGEISGEDFDTFNYRISPPEGGIVTGYGLLDGRTVTVNITQFDGERIKGTFFGEVKCMDCNGNVETISITKGVIDVEYEGELY